MTSKLHGLEVMLNCKLFPRISILILFFPSIIGENTIFIPTLTHYLSKYSLYKLKFMIILEVTDFLASSFGSQRPIHVFGSLLDSQTFTYASTDWPSFFNIG